MDTITSISRGQLKIDAALLCCPVCFEFFPSAPLVLCCGHSFCERCINRLQRMSGSREKTGKAGITSGSGDQKNSAVETNHGILAFHCPMCRRTIPPDTMFRNYLIDDILKNYSRADKIEKELENECAVTESLLDDAKKKNHELESLMGLFYLRVYIFTMFLLILRAKDIL